MCVCVCVCSVASETPVGYRKVLKTETEGLSESEDEVYLREDSQADKEPPKIANKYVRHVWTDQVVLLPHTSLSVDAGVSLVHTEHVRTRNEIVKWP